MEGYFGLGLVFWLRFFNSILCFFLKVFFLDGFLCCVVIGVIFDLFIIVSCIRGDIFVLVIVIFYIVYVIWTIWLIEDL